MSAQRDALFCLGGGEEKRAAELSQQHIQALC